MSAVAFDNTMLSALLNPSGKPLRIPGTDVPIDCPKERDTDDKGLADRARLCGIIPVSLADCPIPETAAQMPLQLDPHEPMPEAETDDEIPE